MTWVALTRMKAVPEQEWVVFTGGNPLPMDAARSMRDLMIKHGFHQSELYGHYHDLVNGDMLTSDDGRQFKVEPTMPGREVVPPPVRDPLLDLLEQAEKAVLTPKQQQLRDAADALLLLLDTVPETTIHYAVTQAQTALKTLRFTAFQINMGD